jgi:hypothetical protein
MSALVAAAKCAFPGPVEAHGVDPKKAEAELARVTEERNTAMSAVDVLTRERDTAWRDLEKLREENVVRGKKRKS